MRSRASNVNVKARTAQASHASGVRATVMAVTVGIAGIAAIVLIVRSKAIKHRQTMLIDRKICL